MRDRILGDEKETRVIQKGLKNLSAHLLNAHCLNRPLCLVPILAFIFPKKFDKADKGLRPFLFHWEEIHVVNEAERI